MIDLNRQREKQQRVNAEREDLVEELVSDICELILMTEPDNPEKRNRLTQRAALWLSLRALNLRSVYKNTDRYNRFDTQIDKVVGQKIFNNQLKPAVGDWVWVQMAKRFVEKAAKPFDDRLREHDWNN